VPSDSSRADGWSPICPRPRHQGSDKDIRKSVRNQTLRIKNHFASLRILDCQPPTTGVLVAAMVTCCLIYRMQCRNVCFARARFLSIAKGPSAAA